MPAWRRARRSDVDDEGEKEWAWCAKKIADVLSPTAPYMSAVWEREVRSLTSCDGACTHMSYGSAVAGDDDAGIGASPDGVGGAIRGNILLAGGWKRRSVNGPEMTRLCVVLYSYRAIAIGGKVGTL